MNAKVCKACGHKFPGGAQPGLDGVAVGGMGCGLLMVLGFLGMLHSCITSDRGGADGVDVEQTLSPAEFAKHEVADVQERLARSMSTCKDGPSRLDPDGKIALAEADVAMAESMHSVSREQEWRIRASIGAELGLAPSQVDGWRDIYRSRAEAARRLLAQVEADERERRESACANVPNLEAELARAEAQVSRESGSR